MTPLEKIRALCLKKGVTITQLERDCGFSVGSLSQAEFPRADRLSKIADYFGVSMEYVMDKEDGYYTDDETAKTAQAIYDSKELSLLFDAAKDAKPEDLMTAYNVLLALKRKDWRNDA